MGARYVALSVLAWASLSVGNESVLAQSAPSGVQALPPIVVSRTAPAAKRARPRTAVRTVRPAPTPVPTAVPTLGVYPTTPDSGSGIDIQKVPSSVNVVDRAQIERLQSANIADALVRYVPSVDVN